jgi:PAS domain S-box-containing protein
MNETTTLPSPKKSPSEATLGNGKPARQKAGHVPAKDSSEAQSRLILAAIMAFRDGDFSVRLPGDWTGTDAQIAEAFNQIIAQKERGLKEVTRLSETVGKEGRLKQRMSLPGAVGAWATEVNSINTLIDDLVRPTSEIARDMTERIQTGEALRLSDARYRALIQALPAALYLTDERGRITLYNKAATALWGREPEVGKDLWCGSWKIYRPDGTPLPLEECPMAVTLRQGRAIRGEEIVIERADGTRRHVMPHPEPMYADGVVIGAINMLIDVTDLHLAERAKAHLAAIVMSSEDAIVSKNLQGIVTSWNGAAERLFGYTAEEMIGQPVSRLIPPDRHDEEPSILERIGRGESIEHYETIRRRKDGTHLPISLTVSPLIDHHGKIIGVSKIARNITEQKRVEESLRENEERLRTLADNISQFAWTADSTGWVFWYNRRWYEYTGTTFEEMQGWGWEKVHHPEHLDRVVKKWRQAQATGEPWEDTFPLRGLDGNYRWFLSRALPIRNAEGRIVQWFGTNTDVTEQREAEAALGESEQRYRTTFANAAVGIAHVGIDGRWLGVNDAVCRITGYGREELLMKPFAEITHPDDLDPEWANARRLLAGECATYSMEKRYIRKEGGLTWIQLTVSLQPDEAGSPQDFICIIEDITTRKQAEDALLERDRALTAVNEALKKQTMALAEANKELEGFSYSVSHDLRAPLRTIDAFSRILEEDHGLHLNDDARRSISIVRKAVGQAGELIDDLLEFSKLGRQGMNFRLVKMMDLAREAADDLRILQEGRQIDLTIGDLPSCWGDRRFLKLVWINLLTNAFKYTKHRNESRIEVGWMPDDARSETVIYYVKDNGIGFNKAYAHKLFGVFQRLHRKEDFDGTGVGLAVVQRIVQRHDGRVWAEGKEDDGATFFFSLRKAMA